MRQGGRYRIPELPRTELPRELPRELEPVAREDDDPPLVLRDAVAAREPLPECEPDAEARLADDDEGLETVGRDAAAEEPAGRL